MKPQVNAGGRVLDHYRERRLVESAGPAKISAIG